MSGTALQHGGLAALPLAELMARARAVRDEAHGRRVTFSPKVFIPLTMLCRDRCGYCTFAQPPARLESPYLSPEQVLALARAGAEAGSHDALFPLGAGPADRYQVAAECLADHATPSNVQSTAAMCPHCPAATGPPPPP